MRMVSVTQFPLMVASLEYRSSEFIGVKHNHQTRTDKILQPTIETRRGSSFITKHTV
jgi:hypothetical protein